MLPPCSPPRTTRRTFASEPQLEGAHEFEVTEADILHVPARSWHQVVVPEGGSITYALINVFE